MSLILTEVEAYDHKLPGIGQLQYLYNHKLKQLQLYISGKLFETYTGDLALKINDEIIVMKDELSPYEQMIDRKAKIAFGHGIEILRMRTRKQEIKEERQMAMWWVKKTSTFSLAKIGALLGYYDHATVLNAIKVVNNLRDTDVEFRLKLERFINADPDEKN